MKHFLTIVLLLMTFSKAIADTKTISISFSENDFIFSTNERGELLIKTTAFSPNFEETSSTPALPFKPIGVNVPVKSSYNSHNVTVSKRLLKENVIVAPNTLPYATDAQSHMVVCQAASVSYPLLTFPSENVVFALTSDSREVTTFHFAACPFEYDASSRRLYFIDHMTIAVEYDSGLVSVPNRNSTWGSSSKDSTLSIISPTWPIYQKSNEEYMIITSENLRAAFQKLADWKLMKGIKTKLVTTEEITKSMNQTLTPALILSYIKRYTALHSDSLKYLLLGGAQNVIPVQLCSAIPLSDSATISCKDLPCDLFYAGFFSDTNNNGVYGDGPDEIRFDSSSYYVSRLPADTPECADSLVNKIINYEKDPLDAQWNDNILMAGNKIRCYRDENEWPLHSDAEIIGETFYANFIEPYWSGNQVRFYDTLTDFPSGADHMLDEINLQAELSKGYTFVNMNTHGNDLSWKLELGIYFVTAASHLKSPGYSVITTTACNTNAIDSGKGLCLSEVLIRNPHSGVIAYLGSSRNGYGDSLKLGSSDVFNGIFYERLLTNPNNHFGELVHQTKAEFLREFPLRPATPYLLLAINPIGDPEMPIYRSRPLSPIFPQMYSHEVNGEDYIYVSTPTNECTIAVTCHQPDGTITLSGVVHNQSKALFRRIMGLPHDVCITAPGHAPCYIRVSPYAVGFLSAGDPIETKSKNTNMKKSHYNLFDYLITLPK